MQRPKHIAIYISIHVIVCTRYKSVVDIYKEEKELSLKQTKSFPFNYCLNYNFNCVHQVIFAHYMLFCQCVHTKIHISYNIVVFSLYRKAFPWFTGRFNAHDRPKENMSQMEPWHYIIHYRNSFSHFTSISMLEVIKGMHVVFWQNNKVVFLNIKVQKCLVVQTISILLLQYFQKLNGKGTILLWWKVASYIAELWVRKIFNDFNNCNISTYNITVWWIPTPYLIT